MLKWIILIGCGIVLTGFGVSAQTFTPPGGSLLFETSPGISVFDGRKETKIAPLANVWSVTPSWTSGGITFMSDRSGTLQIWYWKFNGSITKIGNLPESIQAQRPQRGLNGQFVFAATTPETVPNSNQTIYTMKSDGSDLRVLTSGMQPGIAPSGNWLVFTRQVDEPYRRQLWRINIDGSGEQQLTWETAPDGRDSNAASISPDETKIAFFSGFEQDMVNPQNQSLFTYGDRNVWVMSATGEGRHRVTDCKPVRTQVEIEAATKCIVADNPDWASNTMLIFDIMFKNRNETWKINIDKTGFGRFYNKLRGVVPVSVRRN